jgi:glycosyltransferase involved in cell wall biosynthesis
LTATDRRQVVYLGPRVGRVETGGQRFDSAVIAALQGTGWATRSLHPPSRPRLPAPIRHAEDCLWLLRHVVPLLGNTTVVVENLFLHTRALPLNLALRARRGPPLVYIAHHLSWHDFDSTLYRGIDRALTPLSLRLADHIVTVSESTKRALLLAGAAENKVDLIRNGCDAPCRERSPRADGWLHALFVGACIPRKGLGFLIRALALLRDCRVKLDVVGDLDAARGYAENLFDLTRALSLEDQVSFHGVVPREALWEHYARADLFVLPSLWEGYGVALLDATAFALPIVATRVGGIPEIVSDGENGLLAPPRDAIALAGLIRRLCTDASLRRRLEDGSRSRRASLRSVATLQAEFVQLVDRLVPRNEG